jgi:hypothetical protein
MGEDDGRRYDVRWFDERVQRWGTVGQQMPLRVAEGAMGILRHLHAQVELVELEQKKVRR